MKNLYSVVLLSLLAIGCGQQPDVVVKAVEVPGSPPAVNEIQQVVDETNEYRNASGQSPIAPGLSCILYNLSPVPAPSGSPTWYRPSAIPTSLPTATATFTYIGDFNQPEISSPTSINILPQAFQNTLTQWYMVRCTGQLVVVESDYYSFELTSDDGSNLYLDGSSTPLVANDGLHAMQTKSGTKLLQRGIHAFKLDYFSATGNQGLILTSSGEVIPGEYFYR